MSDGNKNILGSKQIVVVDEREFCVRLLLAPAKEAKLLEALGGLEKVQVKRSDFDHFLAMAEKHEWYLAFVDRGLILAMRRDDGLVFHMYPTVGLIKWLRTYTRVFSSV